tara:strand:- start:1415 stop:1543 length:129 start_codon:yes stop_codon:yes gene_type:complete
MLCNSRSKDNIVLNTFRSWIEKCAFDLKLIRILKEAKEGRVP